jgi:ATP-dependent protease HslVU (ClpYQ) peptidase subunit
VEPEDGELAAIGSGGNYAIGCFCSYGYHGYNVHDTIGTCSIFMVL